MMLIVGIECACGYAVDNVPDWDDQRDAITAGSNVYNLAVDAIRAEHACPETTYHMHLQEAED